MKASGLQQIIVTSTVPVLLDGYWVEPQERMIALYLDADGQAVLFGNEILAYPPHLNCSL